MLQKASGPFFNLSVTLGGAESQRVAVEVSLSGGDFSRTLAVYSTSQAVGTDLDRILKNG